MDDLRRTSLEHGRFRVDIKEWDSEFFSRPIGLLTWSGGPTAAEARPADQRALSALCDDVDAAGLEITECQMDLTEFAMAACLEDVGFRLVDSRIRFLTRCDLRDTEIIEPKWGRVRPATVDDRDRIIDITHDGFTDNDHFVSRFKNPAYFDVVDTRRYFEAWIDSTAFSDESATAVLEVDGEVVGYFIYQVRGTHDGLPVVKGVLAAATSEHRGAGGHLAMQSFLYAQLGLGECYLDNVTQLSNTPVIRNHVRSHKRFESTTLTFYRPRG